jgi:hypothetical protein
MECGLPDKVMEAFLVAAAQWTALWPMSHSWYTNYTANAEYCVPVASICRRLSPPSWSSLNPVPKLETFGSPSSLFHSFKFNLPNRQNRELTSIAQGRTRDLRLCGVLGPVEQICNDPPAAGPIKRVSMLPWRNCGVRGCNPCDQLSA